MSKSEKSFSYEEKSSQFARFWYSMIKITLYFNHQINRKAEGPVQINKKKKYFDFQMQHATDRIYGLPTFRVEKWYLKKFVSLLS